MFCCGAVLGAPCAGGGNGGGVEGGSGEGQRALRCGGASYRAATATAAPSSAAAVAVAAASCVGKNCCSCCSCSSCSSCSSFCGGDHAVGAVGSVVGVGVGGGGEWQIGVNLVGFGHSILYIAVMPRSSRPIETRAGLSHPRCPALALYRVRPRLKPTAPPPIIALQ